MYLEDGSEVCRNSVMNIAYGGGVNVQQTGSKLIMNGGLIQDNTAGGMGPGIAVNKSGDCYFEMNGGVVDNGTDGVLLFDNRVSILGQVQQDSDGNGRLILNEGTVSGVTVLSRVRFGNNTANQYRNLYISDKVEVETGYLAVGGRMQSASSTTNLPWRVTLLPDGGFGALNIGNPNTATYPTVLAGLPKGWTMPTNTAENNNTVIAFWIKKTDTPTADFSVPAPTSGTAPTNYDRSLKYFAAVLEVNATGNAESGASVKLYPTKIVGGQIVVSVPLSAYPNGATVALVQPSSAYGELVFDAPSTLLYVMGATDYIIPYTGEYDISLLLGELIADGHDESNTTALLTIRPDPDTVPDASGFSITSSDIFELDGTPTWDSATGELTVPVKLKSGWDSASEPVTTFGFDCTLNAADFLDGGILSLTGELEITGGPLPPNYFLVPGNYADTEMVIPRGNLKISKTLTGNNTDPNRNFHFTVTFSDGGTYDGIVSGVSDAVTLKGGEDIVITGIPQGVTYTVVETEANQDGYTTTSTGASGTIAAVQSEATFVNANNKDGGGGGGGGNPPADPPADPPSDSPKLFIDDHVAYVIGYPDNTVRPEQNITRAEVATVFFRLLTDEMRDANRAQTNTFPDVQIGHWYNNAISVMSKMGIINGYPDGSFKADGAITRAELAAIAARFAREMDMSKMNSIDFNDTAGHWAAADILYSAEIGWVNGYPDGTFKPDQNITRAEFMTLANRMLERVPESPEDLLSNEMIRWIDNADSTVWYYLAVQEATNSHAPEYKEKVVPGLQFNYEYWVEMIPNRDWEQLEKDYAAER